MAAFARKFRSQFTGFARIGGKSMRVTDPRRDASPKSRPSSSVASSAGIVSDESSAKAVSAQAKPQ